ncbi:hypothetical protein Tco_0991644 [Tanacetum coccineum]|uniref:Uncharacterized protein n=1 Tax=Tanacetum coccineum TaxID=301880 RepID=A0ABQ5F057_9ASTR
MVKLSTSFILKVSGLCGLMGGLVPLLSPRFTSKGEKLGSTSIGIPIVSSTSSGQVTGGVYSSNDGRTYGELCAL